MVSSPHHLDATMTQDRWHRMTEVFARLAPGATIEMARAEISALAASVRTEYPEAYDEGAGYDVRVTGLQDQLTSGARPTLWILLGTAAFVLVIACANVANLTLTRVVTRERELVTRAALGATGGMLRRGLLIENLLLSAAGAALGVGLAWLGFDALVAFIGRFTSRATEITLDGRVFGFATAVATLAALLFASLPRMPTADGTPGAAASGRTTDGGAGKRVQRGLVVAQVAVSFVLLVGAGLMGRTFLAVQSVDPGFETDRVLTMEIPTDFGARSMDDGRNYYETILREVRAVPGVRDAGLGTTVPLAAAVNEFPLMELSIEGHVVPPGLPIPRADFRPVSPGYFRTLGVKLLAGRLLEETDRPGTQKVVVVNQSLANRFFPDEDPVGKRLVWGELMSQLLLLGDDWLTIVGVVENSKNYGLDRDVPEAVFHPFAQVAMASTLFVGTTAEPESVAASIQQVIRRLDPSQPIENVLTLDRIRADSLAPRRLNAVLIGGFALLALVIAAVGVFSVLAFSVTQRTREFGIRCALGAGRREVANTVLREGLVLTGVGLGLGTLAAAALSRSLASFLFGVSANDPATFLVVALTFTVVAATAAWVPARRAARVDPMVALRAE